MCKKKLTKRQIKEFAIHYIATQMVFIDAGNIGELDEHPQSQELVAETNKQGDKIARGRRLDIGTPSGILEHVIKNY